jgi:hypothetical protein
MTGLRGTPVRISLGVDISPSTETLNLVCERKELIRSIKLVENSNLENLYSKRKSACGIKGLFDVQEHRGRRCIIVEIRGHVVRLPHILQCRAVTCTEIKVACVKQASFLNVLLDYIKDDFLINLPAVERRLIERTFLGNFVSLPSFGNVLILLHSESLENGAAESSD